MPCRVCCFLHRKIILVRFPPKSALPPVSIHLPHKPLLCPACSSPTPQSTPFLSPFKVNRPSSQPVDQPASQSANQPLHQSTGRSVGRSSNRSNKSVSSRGTTASSHRPLGWTSSLFRLFPTLPDFAGFADSINFADSIDFAGFPTTQFHAVPCATSASTSTPLVLL